MKNESCKRKKQTRASLDFMLSCMMSKPLAMLLRLKVLEISEPRHGGLAAMDNIACSPHSLLA